MTSKTNMHLTNFFFNILNISMHPYLKFNYDFLGLKSLLDNLGFLRGSQTLTSSTERSSRYFTHVDIRNTSWKPDLKIRNV